LSTATRHAALILAAGTSSRLGRPKQLLAVDGQPLVRRAALAALATHPVRAAVVLGAEATAVSAALAGLRIESIYCDDWQEGMGASLRAGVRILQPHCDGLLVVLCDQPALSAAHLQHLVDAWRAAPERAVASRYAATVGVPALLPARWFARLLELQGDAGARTLLRAQAAEVVTVAAPELERDIDDPQDLPDRC
jgi:CTP:molybdopterin cytidylyltransferase MocA